MTASEMPPVENNCSEQLGQLFYKVDPKIGRNMKTYFAFAWLLLIASSAMASGNDSKPNIILINIDDLGYADISPFGGKLMTPNLETMAKEGMLFRSHYAAPLCTPSRAAMMTGCYPKRVMPIPGVLFPAANLGLSPDETTVAEVLKSAGYVTNCIGKWHLGDQPPFLPTKQGFDHYYGIPYSNDMGPRDEGSKSNPDKPLPKKPDVSNPNQKNATPGDETGLKGDAQTPLPLLEDVNVVERVKVEEQHLFTRRYTDRAIAFLRENREKPFFLYLPHNAVHFPHYPPKAMMGQSKISLQKDWVLEVDQSVGQILDELRRLQLDSKTLVVFTSDNGGPTNQGADNTPLRGAKGSTWEGGMRVCTIAWWPGTIQPKTSTNEITSHMDWLATFTSLAGTKPSVNRKTDGIDLSPLLLGQPNAKGHETFYYFKGLELEAVRQGPWKLHLAKSELYHLDEDMAESKDVASQQPEVVKKLNELAEVMDSDLGRKGANRPGVRKLGRVENPLPLIAQDGTVCPGFDGVVKHLP
jgi:arylsulfatase A